MAELNLFWPEWASPPSLWYNEYTKQWRVFHQLRIDHPDNADKYGQFCGTACATGVAAEPQTATDLALFELTCKRDQLLQKANALPHPSLRYTKGLGPQAPASLRAEVDELSNLLGL